MSTEQSPADSAPSVEDRLTAFYTPAPEAAAAEEAEATEATEETETTEVATEEVPEDDGLDDLDVDGVVYRVPKDLKAKVSEWKAGQLRRENYTRKTQELADITRQAQVVAETLQQRQAFETEISKEREQLAEIKAEIKRYSNVDWGNLETDVYLKLRHQFDTLKEQAREVEGSIEGKAKEFSTKTEGQKRRLIEEGYKFLHKAIPNVNGEAVQSARSAAMSIGYTENEVDNVYDARFVALAWKAAQFDKLQSTKSAAVSAVQKAPPVVKPGAGSGQSAAAERNYKDARAALKKSGSPKDAARLFMLRGNK